MRFAPKLLQKSSAEPDLGLQAVNRTGSSERRRVLAWALEYPRGMSDLKLQLQGTAGINAADLHQEDREADRLGRLKKKD